MELTLKAIRTNAGLTQSEAAERVGVSTWTWSNYEKGKTFPDVLIIKKIEKAFAVSYNEINFLPSITVKPYKTII